jgi:nicotinate-nucleotide--dimethylbenzimidazole phosphoribosyltransferase
MTTITSGMLAEFVGEIVAPDPKWLKQARSHLDNLTKPLGSLGRLEDIAARFIAIRNGDIDEPIKKAAYVFAADHGIVAEESAPIPKKLPGRWCSTSCSKGQRSMSSQACMKLS